MSVPYRRGSRRLTDPKVVRKIAGALEGAEEGAGSFSLVTPQPVKVVPPSAMVTDAEGRTCVFASAEAEPVQAAVVGGGLSESFLPADFPLDSVLANPQDVMERPSCA